MTTIEALIRELEMETVATRRVLERVPDDKLGWKPHEKSMSLGQLALHVATTPGLVAELSRTSELQAPQFAQPAAAHASELVPALEESVAKAKAILERMRDAELGETWRVFRGEREVAAMPVAALFRTIMLNHWYHHRGQLSVYLRQVGALVPSIYGPSADEDPFAPSETVAAAA